MKAKISPTEDIDRLQENLEKRVKEVEKESNKLIAEIEGAELLERVPGIESFEVDGEEREGLGGKPVKEEAYARIETKQDVVKAFLATLEGYDLRVLNTERNWDLRNLRQYNPDIKHLKFDSSREFLEIEKTVSDVENAEKVDIEMPETEEEVEVIYREMLT